MFLFRDNPLIVTKEIRFALKNIYGVGFRKAFYLCARAGIGYPVQLNQINEYYYELLHVLLKHLVISDVRIKRRMEFNIAKFTKIGSVKGLRHLLSLPIHGQRTRTNACTQRLKRGKQVALLKRQIRRKQHHERKK